MRIGVIMRYSRIYHKMILYAMSADCAHLKQRTKELNDKPTYTHPFEGHEYIYVYAYKNVKELELK